MSKRKQPSGTNDANEGVNKEIAQMLLELADYEKNVTREQYKSVAYRKAAAAISKHPSPITNGDDAKKLPGVGVKIAKKIDEYLQSGKLEKLEKIRASDENVAIQALTSVTGIGPAHARKLYEEGITSIEELRKHPEKLNHHQQIGLRYFEDFNERIPRTEMKIMEKYMRGVVSQIDDDYVATICGSFRRGASSSGDVDMLVTHPSYTSDDDNKHPELLTAVVDAMKKTGYITDTLSHGDTKYMGVCVLSKKIVDDVVALDADDEEDDEDSSQEKKEDESAAASSSEPAQERYKYRRIDIRLIPRDQYWCGVLYFTGSDNFNRRMRAKAQEKGLILNEYSLRKLGPGGKPEKALPVQSEEDVFKHVGMKYVAPKDRSE